MELAHSGEQWSSHGGLCEEPVNGTWGRLVTCHFGTGTEKRFENREERCCWYTRVDEVDDTSFDEVTRLELMCHRRRQLMSFQFLLCYLNIVSERRIKHMSFRNCFAFKKNCHCLWGHFSLFFYFLTFFLLFLSPFSFFICLCFRFFF